jgi:hypothetical protein
MRSVFSGGAFSFRGDIAQAIARENAPNPCLSIDGIGTIGLPLSDYEAGRIMVNIASQMKSDGGPVWSVGGSKVALKSKAWVSWLDKLVLRTARDKLGIQAPENHDLRCSLTGLHLCGVGAK